MAHISAVNLLFLGKIGMGKNIYFYFAVTTLGKFGQKQWKKYNILNSPFHRLHCTITTRHPQSPIQISAFYITFHTLYSILHAPTRYTPQIPQYFTLHTLHYTLHSPIPTTHSTHYTPHTTLYTPTLHIPHSTPCILHFTLTIYTTLHNSHFTLPHFTHYNPHFTLHSRPHTSHSTFHYFVIFYLNSIYHISDSSKFQNLY